MIFASICADISEIILQMPQFKANIYLCDDQLQCFHSIDQVNYLTEHFKRTSIMKSKSKYSRKYFIDVSYIVC